MTSEPTRPSSREAARTAAGGVALTAAVSLAGALLAHRWLAAEGAQAVMAEWGAARLGVEWSDPPAPPARIAAARALRGAAIGLAAGAFVLAFARATGAVTSLTPLLSVVALVNALLHSSLLAVRDELLLHGLVLRFLSERGRNHAKSGEPLLASRQRMALGLLACGATSAAWAFGNATGEEIPLATLVLEALAGGAFGALWLQERGAWEACGAHAAWVITVGTRGAILARPASGAWGGGGDDVGGGWAAAAAFAPVCAALVLWARHRRHPLGGHAIRGVRPRT